MSQNVETKNLKMQTTNKESKKLDKKPINR